MGLVRRYGRVRNSLMGVQRATHELNLMSVSVYTENSNVGCKTSNLVNKVGIL